MPPEAQGIIEVRVNQVIVGQLDKQKFESLRASVKADWRVWLAQAGNFLTTGWRLVWCCLQAALTLAVVLPIATALLAPQDLSAALATAAQDPAALHKMAVSLCNAILVSAVTAGIAVTFVTPFRDAFDERLAQRLRWHLNVAADGDVRWRELRAGDAPASMPGAQ